MQDCLADKPLQPQDKMLMTGIYKNQQVSLQFGGSTFQNSSVVGERKIQPTSEPGPDVEYLTHK